MEIIPHKKQDGSLVLDSKSGVKNIKQMLKKDRLSADAIKKKIQFFQKTGDNIIQLSPNVILEKFLTGPTFPSLQGPLLDEKVIALMAYEFLSLLLGNLVCESRLDFVREFIKEETKSDKLFIENLHSEKYGALHVIYPELSDTEVIINIILFIIHNYNCFFKKFIGSRKTKPWTV